MVHGRSVDGRVDRGVLVDAYVRRGSGAHIAAEEGDLGIVLDRGRSSRNGCPSYLTRRRTVSGTPIPLLVIQVRSVASASRSRPSGTEAATASGKTQLVEEFGNMVRANRARRYALPPA